MATVIAGERYDVSIIGAGPAGAWAAFCLARRGARVALVDPSHPREKPCGGGVTGRALALVAPFMNTDALPAVTVRSARITASSTATAADIPLADQALIVASRLQFDGALVDTARHAGAQILHSRVNDLRPVAGGFEINTTEGCHRAAFLIGADGANSLVRRRLAAPFRRDQLSLATGFFAHDVTSDQIAIGLVAEPAGYIWSFPRPTHLAIGICAQATKGVNPCQLRALVADWMTRAQIPAASRLEQYSWPIPSLSADDFERSPLSGSRWYLVGDAAGLVDPLTREGIFFALLSGQWAAEAILSDDEHRARRYAKRVRREIGNDLARAARLKTVFFRPSFTSLLIDALIHSASVARVMADLVAGNQGYAGLKWRLVKTLEIGLAGRLLLRRVSHYATRHSPAH